MQKGQKQTNSLCQISICSLQLCLAYRELLTLLHDRKVFYLRTDHTRVYLCYMNPPLHVRQWQWKGESLQVWLTPIMWLSVHQQTPQQLALSHPAWMWEDWCDLEYMCPSARHCWCSIRSDIRQHLCFYVSQTICCQSFLGQLVRADTIQQFFPCASATLPPSLAAV